MNRIQCEDVREFALSFPLADELQDSTFLITGATGLIGSTLIHCLIALDKGIKIIAPVRNKKKAISKFGEVESVLFVECSLETYDYADINKIDYIVHCAAPTASQFFVEHPVETYYSVCHITERLLELAKRQNVKSMVYLSSLEVYGQVLDDSESIIEDFQGYLNPLDVRSSYPMAKRAMENLCVLYNKEYGVNVKIARLTQTTGAGVSKDDNRIIVQFTRLAANKKDIVLYTTGESARPYCYTIDAISAILYVLLIGKNGEAYNVANKDTYISARSMAEYLVSTFMPSNKVIIESKAVNEYAPVTKLKLNTNKIESLGWKPHFNLCQIFERLIFSLSV